MFEIGGKIDKELDRLEQLYTLGRVNFDSKLSLTLAII